MLKHILDLSLKEFDAILKKERVEPYRARQVFGWIFKKHVCDFDLMTDLPLATRQGLKSSYIILSSRVLSASESRDGTAKLLLEFGGRHRVETVHIPEGASGTACLSTQVGCPIRCIFCASGRPGFKRNLSSGEIVEQVLQVYSLPNRAVDHVVLMGMGEPMKNFDSVIQAVRTMKARWGLGLSARRITVSTVGDVPGIRRLAKEEPEVNLAISLHAPDDETRSQLIPGLRDISVSSIVRAARTHFKETGRRVSFEYVLMDGINDGHDKAIKLARLLRGFPVFVNLIPLNPVPGSKFEQPPIARVKEFLRVLRASRIPAALRSQRGTDIEAACGQLAARGN